MKKLLIGSVSALTLIYACQKAETSRVKNVFDSVNQDIQELALTESEVTGNLVLLSSQALDSTAYEMNLQADGSGIVRSSLGSSAVSWKIQRGRLIINIADLKSTYNNGTTDVIQSDKQYALVKKSRGGRISYDLNIMGIETVADNSVKPKFVESSQTELELGSPSSAPVSSFVNDGDKVSIELDAADFAYGLVLGNQIISVVDGSTLNFENGQNAVFTMNGNRYELSLLKVFGDTAFALCKHTSADGVVRVSRSTLVRQTFGQTLTVPLMSGLYKSGKEVVYNFREDGIMEIHSTYSASSYLTWELVDDGQKMVAKRWIRTVNGQPDYFPSDEDLKLCAQDAVANNCSMRQLREFYPLSLTKDSFYLLRKISFPSGEADEFEVGSVNNFKLEPLQ